MSLVQKNVDLYIYTAIERMKIYLQKENGEPKPWTKDIALRDNHFCNLYREFDKCTLWMTNHMKGLVGSEVEPVEILKAIVAWRLVSTQEIFDRWDEDGINILNPSDISEALKEYQKEGIRYNACFIRNTQYKSCQPGRQYCQVWEIPRILAEESPEVWARLKDSEEQTLESVTAILRDLNVTGKFMSYQYALDWFYFLDIMYGQTATDELTWAQAGQGSLQGMNLLLGRNRNDNLKQVEWLENARDVREQLETALREEFGDLVDKWPPVTMQLVQNWCCEFQKYVKYRGKDNCKKRKYVPYKGE